MMIMMKKADDLRPPTVLVYFAAAAAILLLWSVHLTTTTHLLLAHAAHSSDCPHWGYEPPVGPIQWGGLCPEYTLCGSATEQSPVDIISKNCIPITSEHPRKLVFSNQMDPALEFFNNGHTVQVNFRNKSLNTLTYGDGVYELQQFHFHTPSEHTLDGLGFDMEVHFVHKDRNGSIAVVGVWIVAGSESCIFLDSLFEVVPEPAEDGAGVVNLVDVAVYDLIQNPKVLYTYGGSLTTPPCSEGVRWFVLPNIFVCSHSQIDAFSRIIFPNNRPTQPVNDRTIFITPSQY